MSPTLDSFLDVLRRSALVEATALQEQLVGVAPDLPAQKLAEKLVRNGLLTNWQASKVLQGKFKGFFLGRYRLLKLLGKGGMSSVYLAEHVLMKRRCAIKVLPWKLVKDSSYLQRFHREAQAVAALDHPNIVRAYDIDSEMDGHVEIHFLVMEYIEGSNLFERVQKQVPLSFYTAADWMRQGALGLAHAHAAGLVHRDIKPGNFIVDQNGRVKLMDLGLARLVDQAGESLTIAHDEKVLGTADFLAPEQAINSHLVDTRADLYSLGCTFYFLLSGQPPFPEGTLAQRLMAHQLQTPRPLLELRPDVPAKLLEIIEQLMQKSPELRQQSAAFVAQQLADWIQSDQETAQETTPVTFRIPHGEADAHSITEDSDLRLTEDGRLQGGPQSTLGYLLSGTSESGRPDFAQSEPVDSSSVAAGDPENRPSLSPPVPTPEPTPVPTPVPGLSPEPTATTPPQLPAPPPVAPKFPERKSVHAARPPIVIDPQQGGGSIDSQKATMEIVVRPDPESTSPDRHAFLAAILIVIMLVGLAVYSFLQPAPDSSLVNPDLPVIQPTE